MSHPIENIMHSSMEHIKALADVNTVIGDPVVTEDDTMILPVSKVSLGMIVGGGEYLALPASKKNTVEIGDNAEYPFIGASTVGMCLTPLAFLAVQNGAVRVLPAKQECPSDRLIDLVPQMIEAAEGLLRDCFSCGKHGANECAAQSRFHGKNETAVTTRRAEAAAQSAGQLADKAERAADKARSAAEIAYDAAIEASRAAEEKTHADDDTSAKTKSKGGSK